MKFDFEKYKGKFVMWCKTPEEAEEFCKVMHEAGKKWCNNIPYNKETHSNHYLGEICYRFDVGEYGNTKYFKKYNYTILEWSDFRNNKGEKEMKKENNPLLPRDVASVIFNNRNTVVTLIDGRKGVAKCDNSDTFDPYTGFVTAYYKAHYNRQFEMKKMLDGYVAHAEKKGYKQVIISNN